MKKLFFALCVLFSVQFFLVGCITSEAFTRVPKDHQIVPKKIAVVSGFNSGVTALITKDIAKKIAEVLKKKSTFDVMTDKQIKQRLPQYPMDIVDFYFKEEEARLSVAISRTAKAKIDNLQKVLNVDYVLLVWVDQMVYNPNRGCQSFMFGGFYNDTNLSVNTRLLQYPGGYSVGYSAYYPTADRGFFEDLDETFGRLVPIAANQFVDKFIKETNSARIKSGE